MLLKSRISNVDMIEGRDSNYLWRQERCAKFTSSNIHKLCRPKGLGEDGINYIRTRVFESLSRIPSDGDIMTQATVSGLVNEGFGFRAYADKEGIDYNFIRVQKLIYGDDEMFVSTPDGIHILNIYGDEYEVETIEMKCLGPAKHIEALDLSTAEDVKKTFPEYFFQVCDHMVNVDCLTAKLIFYCPDLPDDAGKLHIIHFRKALLKDDIKFLKERKELAKLEFDRIKAKICHKQTTL